MRADDLVTLALLVTVAAAGKVCTIHSATGVTNGNDIKVPEWAGTLEQCRQACQADSRCCLGEFDGARNRCYLKFGGRLIKLKNSSSPVSSFNCTGGCAPPGPGPSPAPPAGPPVPVTVEVDLSGPTTAFPPFWKTSFGSGHATLTLRPDWQRHLKQAVAEVRR